MEKALSELRTAGEPEQGVLMVEYCAQPVKDKLFRKHSAYRIGDKTFFYNCVHEENWLVKHGTLNSATDTLYEEEQSMITNSAYHEELSRAFEIGGIEYGRADFGIVDGRVQIYEINTNPADTKPPKIHPNLIRTRSQELAWEKYCKYLSALDTTDLSGPYATDFKHPNLRRHRFITEYWDAHIRRR